MTRLRLRLIAGASAVAVLATGCANHPATTSTAGADSQQHASSVAVWTRMTVCMRGHGYPNWPDAVVAPDGRGSYPEVAGLDEKAAIDQLQAVCGPILDGLPAGARPSHDSVSAAQLATLREFSRCMRGHGAPEWPDPDPDGGFPLTPAQTQFIGSSGVPDACRAVYSGSIAVDTP